MNGWTVFEILINLYQGFLFIYFINRTTCSGKHSIWIDVASVTAIALFLSSYLFIEIPFIDTVVFIIPFVHALIVSRERWFYKLFWSAVLAAVAIGAITLISNGFMLLTGVSWETILGENLYRLSYVIFCNICLFIILYCISGFGSRRKIVSFSSLLVFLMINVLLLVSVEQLFRIGTEHNITDLAFLIGTVCIFLASLLSLVLYEIMARTISRRQEAEAKLRILQQSQDNQAKLQSMYSAMLEYQHDLKHQYQLLKELLKNNDTAGNNKLLNDTLQDDSLDNAFISTGCISVDALLLADKSVMDANQIQFEYVPYPLDILPINEMDFCILLSNILDNAIEAVRRLPPDAESRRITLRIARSQDNLIIIAQNDYSPDSLHIEGSKYISSKSNQSMHGYGLESIIHICEDSDGSCHITHDDNKFTVRIILPFKE